MSTTVTHSLLVGRRRFRVIFEEAPEDWTARSPELPDCAATGKTLAQARQLIWGRIASRLKEAELGRDH